MKTLIAPLIVAVIAGCANNAADVSPASAPVAMGPTTEWALSAADSLSGTRCILRGAARNRDHRAVARQMLFYFPDGTYAETDVQEVLVFSYDHHWTERVTANVPIGLGVRAAAVAVAQVQTRKGTTYARVWTSSLVDHEEFVRQIVEVGC